MSTDEVAKLEEKNRLAQATLQREIEYMERAVPFVEKWTKERSALDPYIAELLPTLPQGLLRTIVIDSMIAEADYQDSLRKEESGTYISRLTVDIPSRQQPGHIHKAGTEIAPVEKLVPGIWLIEIRVPDETLEGDAWYETIEVKREETEIAYVDEFGFVSDKFPG